MPRIIMYIDPVITGAAIAGGAALASGGASLFANSNMNKKNRKWQEKMVKEQRAHEQKLYDERYSPSAQAQNLRSAGINPTGNTQTMNVGSSTSTPTPASIPLDFSSIGHAGQAIASGLHSREAMKLEERKQISNEVTAWQNHIRDTIRLGMEREELEEQKKIWREQLDNWKLSNHEKRLYNDWLDELDIKGVNPTEISIQKTLADIKHLETQDAYTSALTQTENDLRAGKVTAQTLANMSASFEYELRKEFGHDMADLSYREFKEKVERDETLRKVYIALSQNQQAQAAYQAALSKVQYQDFIALPPWQRYMLQLGSHVVEKGAEFAF